MASQLDKTLIYEEQYRCGDVGVTIFGAESQEGWRWGRADTAVLDWPNNWTKVIP